MKVLKTSRFFEDKQVILNLYDMQRNLNYTRQVIVKQAVQSKHEDYQQLGRQDQNGRQYEAKQI